MPENLINLDFAGMKLTAAHFRMQLGILPSAGHAEMTGDQWYVGFGGVGNLTIEDGGTRICLHNLKATRMRRVEGLDDTSLVRVELKDRRWKWRLKTFTGRFNVVISNDDGNVIFDPDTIDGGSPYSFDEIARLLLGAMGEVSVQSIPIPSTSYVPLNKVWENVNPAEALQEICEEVNYAIALKATDNNVEIVHLGQDPWPVVGERYRINEGLGATFHDKPDYVKVIGNRIQNEVTVTLEPVGIDVDGEIRKLANLAYAPDRSDPDDGTGFGRSALLPKPFSNIAGGTGYTAEQAQALAEKSVFKYFRIANTGLYPDDASRANAGRLPILGTLNSLDSGGMRRGPYVRAKYYEKDQQSGFMNLAELQPPKVSCRIDSRRGLVVFGKRVGTLLEPAVMILSQTKLISLPGSVKLTFAYEMKSDGDEDFYYFLKTDKWPPPPVEYALVLPVKRSDLTLRRIEGADQNRAELDAVAEAVADLLLSVQEKETNLSMEYAGAQAINPNGGIEYVEWDAGETIVTRLRWRDFTPPPTAAGYMEAGPLARLASLPAENRLALEAGKETNLLGGGMRGDASPEDPSSMEFQSLEVINAHHSGVIIVEDSRPTEIKDETSHEDHIFGRVIDVDEATHRHTVVDLGKLIDMRYCSTFDWLNGWIHGSYLDIETTEFLGENIGSWHHLGDNYGAGWSLPVVTRFYYGTVQFPDPVAGDPWYHPSQSIDPRKPMWYVPGDVEDVNRIRIYGEMQSAPGRPCLLGVAPSEEEGIISQMGYSLNKSPYSVWEAVDFGAMWVRKTLTYVEVVRNPWDVNRNTYPPMQTEGLWGMAEFVRFKIFIDPDRTQEQ